MSKDKAIERAFDRAFDRANLAGEGVDLYKIIYSYKALRELPDEEIEEIYDNMAKGLGFMR